MIWEVNCTIIIHDGLQALIRLKRTPSAKIIVGCFLLALVSWQSISAQQKSAGAVSKNRPGAPPGSAVPKHPTASSFRSFITPRKAGSTSYLAFIYTFNDIAIFSYSDNTSITITKRDSNAAATVANVILDADSFDTLSPGNGNYLISGDKPYAVLAGDEITSTASGYYAVDENGSGTSTKLDTWMMEGDASYDPHFIIFAYQSGTDFVVRDLASGDSLYAGGVDSTGYFDFPDDSSIQKKALQVVSNNPVSVLSYTDQGYYVPSSNGTFSGNLFYGFSGFSSAEENSITLVSYADSNAIVVMNLTTGDTIAVDTLGDWQVKTLGITEDTFWKVTSTRALTAANIPFEESWEGQYLDPSYWYLDRVADSTGKNIGTSFIVPSTQSDLSICSFDDNNNVQITLLSDSGTVYPYRLPVSVSNAVLQSDSVYTFATPIGDCIYRIQSTGNISVVQGGNGSGADFMPVNNWGTTGVIAAKTLPTTFVLYQNYPNPFNPATIISYQLSVSSHVTLKVYDVLGRELKTLVDENKTAGKYAVKFNSGNLSSGVYFYRVNAIGSDGHLFTATKKFMLLK